MPVSIIASAGGIPTPDAPRPGSFRSIIKSGKVLIKTILRFEVSVPVIRDKNGDVDYKQTFSRVGQKVAAKLAGVSDFRLTFDQVFGEKGKAIISADGNMVTIMLPMWLADP